MVEVNNSEFTVSTAKNNTYGSVDRALRERSSGMGMRWLRDTTASRQDIVNSDKCWKKDGIFLTNWQTIKC